jgi:serine/threonine-protein kinase
MGTPLYMSPEQAQGHDVDHRSDLYSLGVTFYHMLTGEPPFRGDTALAVALKQVREAPRSMLVHRGDLPADLDRLVLKLIAKSPSDRYQSANEMLADLVKLRDKLPIGSTVTVSDTGQTLTQTEESPAARGAGSGVPKSPAVGSTARGASADWGSVPIARLARLSWPLVVSIGVASSLCGAVLGWSARNPDLSAIPNDTALDLPGLWLEPRWSAVPRQESADEQLRYALLQAPREEWARAFMAVPGHFPHAHDQISRAYTQLARILYRRADVSALTALETELSQWKDASGYDQELVHVVHVAIKVHTAAKMGKADFVEVAEGFRKLTRDEVPDMYDLALLELSLEICADASGAAVHAGTELALQQDLHQFQMQLVRRLYRIELPKMNRALSRAALKKQ